MIRYYANSKNKLWIIYTGSEFKNPKLMQPYPNLKMHLDRFKDVITSDNKPYGLHRIREERFFKGESITAQRKCPYRPSFSYTDFDCYVSATFYVIEKIKNNSHYYNVKFNSKTGGLMATHVDHIFDPKKGWREVEVQKIGYKYGRSVIFESEKGNPPGIKHTDGFWDGKKFEIASSESGSSLNIRDAMKHCASKKIHKLLLFFYSRI